MLLRCCVENVDRRQSWRRGVTTRWATEPRLIDDRESVVSIHCTRVENRRFPEKKKSCVVALKINIRCTAHWYAYRMATDSLTPLIGDWVVKSFVDIDDHTKRVGRDDIPVSCKDIIRRGERLRLVATTSSHVLYGKYLAEDIGFWIVHRPSNNRVAIHPRGELRHRGSFVLIHTDEKSIVWKSNRRTDGTPERAIQWRRAKPCATGRRVVVPDVPKTFSAPTGHRKCACGDKSCAIAVRSSDVRTVKLSRPTINKNARKHRRLLSAAIAKAQWGAFVIPEHVTSTYVYLHHLHPFARAKWLELCSTTKSPKFKTFTIPREVVEVNVATREISPYFLLVEELGVYVPKFTSGPPSSRCTTSASRVTTAKCGSKPSHERPTPMAAKRVSSKALRNDSKPSRKRPTPMGAKHSPNQPMRHDCEPSHKRPTSAADKRSPCKPLHDQDTGANVIRDLRSTVKTLKAENQLLKRQLQEARQVNENRHRRFFTRQFHCSGHRSHHCLRNWFGLTKDFDDLTKLVQIFLPTYNVEEAHSRDEHGAKLTPFEQCLLAKAYEYDVLQLLLVELRSHYVVFC